MHICFIAHEYPLWNTGGIGSFIQTIGRSLVAKGHRVSVLMVEGAKAYSEVDDQGVCVVRLAHSGWKRFSFIPNYLQLRKTLKRLHGQHPIDIVEAPEIGLAFLPRRTPYKKVIRLHGGHHFFAESENRDIQMWKGIQERLSFANADAFIAVSQYVRDHTAKYLCYHGKPLSVIRLPLDAKLFCPNDKIVPEPYRLVFAGTVCEKKGIRQLIGALPLVAEKFPQVVLHVYGRDWYYPDKRSYINQLKENTPADVLQRVVFHGPVQRTQMPDAFRMAHLCVFPSHMETLGLVAPEAMLTGRPVLFSEKGPGPEIVAHMSTGLLCNPHDENDIASKICWAFEHPDQLNEIAHAGYADALETFNMERLVDDNVLFYSSLIK
jgi:glycosyltransferase involved in cell wall biosynthesis